MALKYDLPSIGIPSQAYLLDGSANFSIQVPQSNGHIWHERYYQNKADFTPLPIGTVSTVRPDHYLVKEQGFRDIGAGLFEFERLYANVPASWSETQELAFNYVAERIVSSTEGGVEVFSTSKSAQVSTEVNHSYVLGYPGVSEAESLTDPTFNAGDPISAGTAVRPKEVVSYLGDIWEIKTFTLLVGFTA